MTPVPQDYETAKAERDALDKRVSELGTKLKSYPRGAMNLVSDEARATPEYRADKAAYDRAFADLKNYNSTFVKRFKKEEQARRRIRWT